ncbi:MAG: LCP family protein [Anaerolineales bacterium]|nr:LCP family protein [Anaerolineales bacterium]
MKKKPSKKSGKSTWLVWLLGAAYCLGLLVSMVLVFRFSRELSASWTGVGVNPFQMNVSQEADETQAAATPTMVTYVEMPEPWDGKRRITILLMGLDYRDWVEGSGYPRTDSMMLASIDPIAKTGSMLSIPRDLFVEIPYAGYVHNRINAAYPLGEQYQLPGGGPQLAMETVEDLMGIPIDYYAVIDFYVFEQFVDEIGGIDVLVHDRMKISPIGKLSYWLEPKAYHLDGADALAYARVRKVEGGDFSRAERQQQVAMAVRDRILGFDVLPSLIARAPELYMELSGGVRTNLTLDQMLRLGILALNLPKDNIRTGVIGPPTMVGFATLPDGRQVLRAVTDQIRILRDELFIDTGSMRPAAEMQADGTISE